MKSPKRPIVILMSILLGMVLTVGAADVEEIVRKANLAAYYAGKDGRANVTMTITDKQGRERKRSFVMLRKDVADGGDQKFYVYFNKPEDIRDMVYMVWKHVGKDDDRWLYLPALDLVRRIAASDKRSSFIGSDFLYEDVSGRSLDEDTHELTGETEEIYLLKNIPKDPKSVEFSYFTVAIDKVTYLPLKAEYFDRNGKKYRVVEAVETKMIGGHPTVVRSRAENFASGSSTVAEFSGIAYDIGLTDAVFTERYLRKAPRKWIQ